MSRFGSHEQGARDVIVSTTVYVVVKWFNNKEENWLKRQYRGAEHRTSICKHHFKSKILIRRKKNNNLMTRFYGVNFRASYRVLVWLVKGIKMYYTESRPHLKRSIMNCVIQQAFRNAVFRVALIFDQFNHKVEQHHVSTSFKVICLSKQKTTWDPN